MALSPKPQAVAGDECESCRTFWQSQNKPPKLLVGLAKHTDYGVPIVVCPYCDGEPIIRNNSRASPEGNT